jgi:hypothetical protein
MPRVTNIIARMKSIALTGKYNPRRMPRPKAAKSSPFG